MQIQDKSGEIRTIPHPIKGHRYLFCETTPWGEIRTRRAEYRGLFADCKYPAIVTTNVEGELSSHTIVYTPFSWITNILSLDDILDGETVLPTDVLIIIDSYA